MTAALARLVLTVVASLLVTLLGVHSAVGEGPLRSLQGEKWAALFLTCHADPSHTSAAMDAILAEIDGAPLGRAEKDSLRRQVLHLQESVNTSLGLEEKEAVALRATARTLSKYASNLRPANRASIEDINLIQDYVFSATPKRDQVPELRLLASVFLIEQAILESDGKNAVRLLAHASDAIDVCEKCEGIPFFDSQCIWKARYLAEVKSDLAGAVTLLRDKTKVLSPLSNHGFGYDALCAELVHYGLLSGQRAYFVEGMNALDALAKRGDKSLVSQDCLAMLRLCAPAYQRMAMQGGGYVETMNRLRKSMIVGIAEDQHRETNLRAATLSLGLANDLGADGGKHQDKAARNLESLLRSSEQWNLIEFEAASQLIAHRLYRKQSAEAIEFMKHLRDRLSVRSELTNAEHQAVRLFAFLTNESEEDSASIDARALISEFDKQFGDEGSSAARIRLIILLSARGEELSSAVRLSMVKEAFRCLRNGVGPNGSIERLAALELAEKLFRETKSAAETAAIERLKSEEDKAATSFSRELRRVLGSESEIAELTGLGAIKIR